MEIDIEWIKEVSGNPDAELLDVSEYRVVLAIRSRGGGGLEEEINARHIIRVGEVFLVEDEDNPDDWLMGKKDRSGKKIVCRGYYGELESVLEGLRATQARS